MLKDKGKSLNPILLLNNIVLNQGRKKKILSALKFVVNTQSINFMDAGKWKSCILNFKVYPGLFMPTLKDI